MSEKVSTSDMVDALVLINSHPDSAKFFQQIVSNPLDITLRLVYADWLEETGDERFLGLVKELRRVARVLGRSKKTLRRKAQKKAKRKRQWVRCHICGDQCRVDVEYINGIPVAVKKGHGWDKKCTHQTIMIWTGKPG